ncbi:CCR4-NOT core subunit cdc39, partial [Rhizina undulata]
GWATFANLPQNLLSYVAASLKDQSLAPIIKVLYRGVLRILLVLHYDFARGDTVHSNDDGFCFFGDPGALDEIELA